LLLDLDGNILENSKYKSTSETPIHLTILRNRPDINVVIHTHSPYATVVGLTDLEFQPITSDAVMLGELPIVEWTTTGTAESGKILSEAFSEKKFFVLIRNHGLVVGGPTLEFASGITTMVEDTCKELVLCHQLGLKPRLLPVEKIEIIHGLMKKGSV
jgi:L-fuculose-phosphate aldolase